MGLNQTANNKPCFAFSPHQGGFKNKDWLCELGCRALRITCEMKNPCSVPRAFQSHCTACFPFISAGRKPEKFNEKKKYHNSKDSAGDEKCSPEASFNTSFLLPPSWSGSSVLIFVSPICWASSTFSYRVKRGVLESVSSHWLCDFEQKTSPDP